MSDNEWHDVGSVEELAKQPVSAVRAGSTVIAIVCQDGSFSAISGACNHVGGPARRGLTTAWQSG